ncbi:hypothetical protein AALP_AAs46147U000300 [Arabis alpina]|uniref:Uncharacterized protein n=1 Tax=Arabis alpina TaxID=50452 RepID=A0A087FXU6_ARAAL|nr:hypothetical protein AALP_AAs46147U000300 [Arabis alpina]
MFCLITFVANSQSSFVRFDNVIFVRTKEYASKQKSILASA